MQTSSKPVWKSASELGYPDPSHAATGTTSRLAWGARNLIFHTGQNRRRSWIKEYNNGARSSGIAHTLSTSRRPVAKAAWSMPGSSSNLDGDGGGA